MTPLISAQAVAATGVLNDDALRSVLTAGLESKFSGRRVLALIPDHTRSLPLPALFRLVVEILHDVRQLDFMVALGTHPALTAESINQLVAKYLFPGISGPDMINATHWLGALACVVGTIGVKDTPLRAMIHAAVQRVPTPITLAALVVQGRDLAGVFIGDVFEAWQAAADLSSQLHIQWCKQPFQRVLSRAPLMYDELWTAGKAMYKMEPAVAVGGEVIIYAPHLDIVSHVHGKYIYEVGYHILPYFLADWERYRDIPLGVLAHSTHVRGSGVMENGIERPNVRVTLASKIAPADCARLNLGYRDPSTINIADW